VIGFPNRPITMGARSFKLWIVFVCSCFPPRIWFRAVIFEKERCTGRTRTSVVAGVLFVVPGVISPWR
jgi:hypothetical protein